MNVAASQISPAENFDLFFFLRNHTDATTYYIRAVIYDVRTGEVLQTVNLEQSPTNSRLFTKTVQAPGDPAGTGRNIVAIASVYTDSGYTTKSQDYEEQEQYFLIRAVPTLLGGGGGVDYGAVRELVAEELSKAIKPIPAPEPVNLDSLYGAIGALQREINRVPKDALDLEPFREQLTTIQTAIAELPQPEPVDLAPVLEALASSRSAIVELRKDMSKTAATFDDERKLFQTTADEILRRAQIAIKAALSEGVLSALAAPEPKADPAPMPDLSHLM